MQKLCLDPRDRAGNTLIQDPRPHRAHILDGAADGQHGKARGLLWGEMRQAREELRRKRDREAGSVVMGAGSRPRQHGDYSQAWSLQTCSACLPRPHG